jgi:hypothetical protein
MAFPTGNGEITGPGGKGTFKTGGFGAFGLQLGVNYRLTRGLLVGPFAALTFCDYDNVKTETNGVTRSARITDPAFHEWLFFGVRAVADIKL